MGERELPFDVTPEWVRSTGSMLGDCSRFTPEWVIPLTFPFLHVPFLLRVAYEVDYGSHLFGGDSEGPGL